MPRSQAVITGLGIVSAIGVGAEEYFAALLNGASGIRSLSERTDDEIKPSGDLNDQVRPGVWIGGLITDFEPKQYVRPRKALKVMCREIRTAFAASQLAIDNALLTDLLPANPDGLIKPSQIGTVFGGEMYYGPATEMIDTVQGCRGENGSLDESKFGNAARRGLMPLWMLKYLPNMPACHVGILVNAHGPNNTLVLGDTSAPSALIESVTCIERGIANVVISGASGTRVSTTRINYRNDLPIPEIADSLALSSRPHDPRSTGVVGGEAAGSMIIESAESAKLRGVSAIAAITGWSSRFCASQSMASDKRTNKNDQPFCRASSQAIGASIDAALAKANVDASQIGLIVSHASGDPVSDAAERAAISRRLANVPMVAPIASIGHCGAASGSIEVATGALCLSHRVIPPTLNADVATSDVNLLNHLAPLEHDHVLCLSYTSEGHAVAIVLAAV